MQFRGVNCVIEDRISFKVDRVRYPYIYGIRHSEDDWSRPITVEPSVVVNKFGVMFTDKELEIGKEGYIKLTGIERRDIIREVEQ